MNPTVSDYRTQTQRLQALLKEDLKTVRTGRANPGLLENLSVEAYGGQSKLRLMDLGSITTEDQATLVITPYDPAITQDIEKAILKSPLGLTPQVQGTKIIVHIPPLSQEQRVKLMKVANEIIEEKKNNIRNQRDDARRKLKHMLERKELTEDQKFRFEKEIDQITQEIMATIQTIKEDKEKEITL